MKRTDGFLVPVTREAKRNKGCFRFTHSGQQGREEGLFWLDKNRLDQISAEERSHNLQEETMVNLAWGTMEEWTQRLGKQREKGLEKKRVHLLALGDVGGTVLTALKLLGGDCIHTLGIFDRDENVSKRWECEMN